MYILIILPNILRTFCVDFHFNSLVMIRGNSNKPLIWHLLINDLKGTFQQRPFLLLIKLNLLHKRTHHKRLLTNQVLPKLFNPNQRIFHPLLSILNILNPIKIIEDWLYFELIEPLDEFVWWEMAVWNDAEGHVFAGFLVVEGFCEVAFG